MPRCSSAPTISRQAGGRCSPSSITGQAIRPRALPTMPRAARDRPPPISCWPAAAAPGGRCEQTRRAELVMADRKISLVLSDVDGTLVDEHKVLTERAQAAVHSLHAAGIRFAITSGRPPKGMAMIAKALKLETPIAG